MSNTWRPGELHARIGNVGRTGRVAMRMSVTEGARMIERQAKINARNGTHKAGTKTPATRGSGPALISGTLRRSIVQGTEERLSDQSYARKVGMAAGVYPPRTIGKKKYGGNTPASKYALYLETRIGYPFLMPAYNLVAPQIPMIFKKHFDGLIAMGPNVGR